jgi:hypothetical protein
LDCGLKEALWLTLETIRPLAADEIIEPGAPLNDGQLYP